MIEVDLADLIFQSQKSKRNQLDWCVPVTNPPMQTHVQVHGVLLLFASTV